MDKIQDAERFYPDTHKPLMNYQTVFGEMGDTWLPLVLEFDIATVTGGISKIVYLEEAEDEPNQSP